MEQENFRSNCPISSGLDLFGDKWSLLIIRDMMYYGERTFKDFAQAAEKISTARLSDRLSRLEKLGIITKSNHPTNKKVFLYNLTERGLDLTPLIAEYIRWSNKHLPDHISDVAKAMATQLEKDREGTIQKFMEGKYFNR
ncbi:MAG TPA: transcriptional regulator [Microscillaceae bacterium]|nr:transcriptional regulator [Microscillaceae bacterium]